MFEYLERRLMMAADFGDAPAPYATLLADNGARHEAVGPWLGAVRDAEADGAPSALSDGEGADDDGMAFGVLRVGQAGAVATVYVSGAPAGAKLDGWIDFNADGSWGGPGEQIFASAAVAAGENSLSFEIPSWAVAGATVARFRLSTAGALGFRGAAANGEVEDYRVVIAAPLSGDGVFGGEVLLPKVANDSTPQNMFPIDFDRDGDFDLLSGQAGSQWYENQNGAFASRKILPIGGVGPNVAGGDLDGDGDHDIVVGDGSILGYLNNGDQTFVSRTIASSTANVVPLSMADVDGDGDLDVLGGATTLAWFENNGSETFTRRPLTGNVGLPKGFSSVDLDGDGDLDLLASGSTGLGWYENNGANAFTLRSLGAGAFGRAIARDLDGDGDQDVVTSSNKELRWYENDGSQTFVTHVAMTAASTFFFYVDAADMDGDGDLDLLSTADLKVTWHANDGASNFTTHALSAAEGAVVIAAVDVDGDGVLDIVSGSTTGDKFAWRRQAAAVDFGDAPEPYPTTLAEIGAHHYAAGPLLGATRASEADGVHGENDADDDGVTLGVVQVGGGSATATVQVIGAAEGAKLSAWIDFNGDGSWGGGDEQIAADWAVVEGANVLQFAVPGSAKPGTTYARFRLSTAGGLGTVGGAADGEVEDYAVPIQPPALATGAFAAGQTLGSGSSWSFPTDLDLDGDVDVLAGGSWHENDGGGVFTTRSLIAAGSPSHTPYFVFHASDMDGDGDVDLMGSGPRIYWYENDGNELFTVHATNTTGFGYYIDPPVAADVDGDGAMDVVAVVNGGGLVWYRNDGRQNFTAQVINSSFSASAIVVDLDRDGDLDIVTPLTGGSFSGSSQLRWYENSNNSFVLRELFVSVSGVQPFNTAVAGDLDGDGDIDLVVGTSQVGANPSIYILINRGAQGFTARSLEVGRLGSTWPGMGLQLADLNGDGDLDILAAIQSVGQPTTRSLVWLDNQGGLSFVKRPVAPSITNLVTSMFAVDLDGDGALDALTAGGRVTWHANQPIPNADFGDAPATYPTLRSENGAAHGAGGPKLGALHSPDGSGAHSPLADGDASDDGVTFGGVRAGQLNAAVTVDVRNAPSGARVDAWIDFNGDGTWNQGDEQIFASAAVVEGVNTLHFAAPATAASGTTFARVRISTAGGLTPKNGAIDGEVEDYAIEIQPPAAATTDYSGFNLGWFGADILRPTDLDGDGDLDVLSNHRIYSDLPWAQNLGGGAFLLQRVNFNGFTGSTAGGVRAVDLDRDGDLDVAFATNSQIGWYENNGAESFRLRLIPNNSNIQAKSLEVVDLDGDGDLDLLTAGIAGVVVLVNDGNQSFASRTLATTTSALATVSAADFDGDGDLDIAAAFDSSTDGVRWYQNDGSANFTARTATLIRSPLLVPTDLDGDGDVDLVAGLGLGQTPATLSWLENDGLGTFTVRSVGTASAFGVNRIARERVAAGDADGDGDGDLVVADGTRVWLFRNDGSESFVREQVIEDLNGFYSGVAVADLNGDGDLEILAADSQRQSGGWIEARTFGDYDRDGYVNDADLSIWQNALGQPVATPGAGADGNRNGVVDEGDRDVVIAHLGAVPYAAVDAANYDPSFSQVGQVIDGADFLAWQRQLGTTVTNPPTSYTTDWNRDGVVDGGDLALWTRQFGQGVSLDGSWIFSTPGAAAATAVAAEPYSTLAVEEDQQKQASSVTALDAVYAAGDFTALFAPAEETSRWFRRGRRGLFHFGSA